MDTQRLKEIRSELKAIEESSYQIWSNFTDQYSTIPTSRQAFAKSRSEFSAVNNRILEELEKISPLKAEAEEGRKIAIFRNDAEMLREAEGRIAYTERLEKEYRNLLRKTIEDYNSVENDITVKPSRKIGLRYVDGRYPDNDGWLDCWKR